LSAEPAIAIVLAPFSIYVFTPILGLLTYWALVRKMRTSMVVSPPAVPFLSSFSR
jgi:hypothetical protein